MLLAFSRGRRSAVLGGLLALSRQRFCCSRFSSLVRFHRPGTSSNCPTKPQWPRLHRSFYREDSSSSYGDSDPAFAPSRLADVGLSNADAISKLLHVLRRPYWGPEVERELELLGIKPTEFQMNEVLKNLGDHLEVANGFFQWIRLQNWYVPNSYSFTILINLLGRHKDFDSVQRTVSQMKEDRCPPTAATYNTLIKVYGKAQRLDDMWDYYTTMQADESVVPDNFTFNTLMNHYSFAGQSEKVVEVYDEMERLGCRLDKLGYEMIIPHAGKMGKLELACKLFEEMKAAGHQPNSVAYSALVAGQLKSGRLEIGVGYYEGMRKAQLRPLLGTFAALIEAFCKSGRLEVGLKFLEDMKEFNYKPNLAMYAALIEAHSKAGLLDAALRFYDDMRSVGLWPPPLIFACLIEQHASAGKVDTAVRLYREMRGVGLKPSHFTCRIVVGAVAKSGRYEDVEKVLFEMQEMGLNASDAINDSIVKLVDERRIDSAWELFLKVSGQGFTPHVSLCREILQAFLAQGDLNRAAQMLSFMPRPGLEADLRTYCMLLESFMRCSREEDEPVLMDFMRSTKHPAHRFLVGILGGHHLRNQPFADYVKSFYSGLEAEVDFKTRRYFTNVVLNYLVVMGQQRRARTLWKVVYQLQLYPNAITLQGDLTWSMRVRYMSTGAALVGVLCTLEKFRERILKRRFVPQRLKILTGPKDDPESVAVKNGLEALFEPLDAPFLFQDDDLGSFWCRGSFFVKWFRQSHVRAILRQPVSAEDDPSTEEATFDTAKLLLMSRDDMPLPSPPGGDRTPIQEPASYRRLPPSARVYAAATGSSH